jgi:hypothetical protein
MLNSSVLDVAIGLIFTFLAFSLAVSSMVEAFASMLNWRSTTLLQGVKDLLNDQKFEGLALNLYNHALVNPRDPGTAGQTASRGQPAGANEKELKHPPAYINADQFAAALVDILGLAGKDQNGMKQAINGPVSAVQDPQLNRLLNGIVDRTSGDLQKVHQELAGWFDNAMDRVGGGYKRRTQLWGFVIALIMAAVLNVSAINIGRTLWRRPMVARAIAPQSDLANRNVIDQLNVLEALDVPVGWKIGDLKNFSNGGLPCVASSLDFIVGWLITAVATLLGAPFWFDALQQTIRLKGAGPSPAEKKANAGAAA